MGTGISAEKRFSAKLILILKDWYGKGLVLITEIANPLDC